ncbi:hypothetical protein [Halococcus sediminicola]|nr:hypothetical protein [Halococcus sediminicola]
MKGERDQREREGFCVLCGLRGQSCPRERSEVRPKENLESERRT